MFARRGEVLDSQRPVVGLPGRLDDAEPVPEKAELVARERVPGRLINPGHEIFLSQQLCTGIVGLGDTSVHPPNEPFWNKINERPRIL